MRLKDLLKGSGFVEIPEEFKYNPLQEVSKAKVSKVSSDLAQITKDMLANLDKYKVAKGKGDEAGIKKFTKIAGDLTKKKKRKEEEFEKLLQALDKNVELVIGEGTIQEQAPRIKTDPDVEKLKQVYKDISYMERMLKMNDSSRYSHVRRDFDKALLHVAKLTNILQRKGPTIPEGENGE